MSSGVPSRVPDIIDPHAFHQVGLTLNKFLHLCSIIMTPGRQLDAATGVGQDTVHDDAVAVPGVDVPLGALVLDHHLDAVLVHHRMKVGDKMSGLNMSWSNLLGARSLHHRVKVPLHTLSLEAVRS